jgi:hypothetical protein
MFVKTVNNIATVFPYTVNLLKADNPQTSFPEKISLELMAEFGVYPVAESDTPPYNPNTQYVESNAMPSLIDGKWVLGKTVINMSADQIKAREDQLKANNKKTAEQLLTETDWTQVADVPLLNKQAFVEYRAAVRAIALNPPVEATFPDLPVEQWS